VDGRKVFPIVLAKGPPADGFREVAAAGVNVLKVGPARDWTEADVTQTIAENRAAAAHGLWTWVNLSAFAQLRPGRWRESLLRHVVGALEADPSGSAVALWKGADEPWRFGDEEPVMARLLVDSPQAGWVAAELGDQAVVERRDDGSVVVEMAVTNREAFRSFVFGLLDHAEVLGPADVRADLVSHLEALAAGGERPA
jgi:hypothetical protein